MISPRQRELEAALSRMADTLDAMEARLDELEAVLDKVIAGDPTARADALQMMRGRN